MTNVNLNNKSYRHKTIKYICISRNLSFLMRQIEKSLLELKFSITQSQNYVLCVVHSSVVGRKLWEK